MTFRACSGPAAVRFLRAPSCARARGKRRWRPGSGDTPEPGSCGLRWTCVIPWRHRAVVGRRCAPIPGQDTSRARLRRHAPRTGSRASSPQALAVPDHRYQEVNQRDSGRVGDSQVADARRRSRQGPQLHGSLGQVRPSSSLTGLAWQSHSRPAGLAAGNGSVPPGTAARAGRAARASLDR